MPPLYCGRGINLIDRNLETSFGEKVNLFANWVTCFLPANMEDGSYPHGESRAPSASVHDMRIPKGHSVFSVGFIQQLLRPCCIQYHPSPSPPPAPHRHLQTVSVLLSVTSPLPKAVFSQAGTPKQLIQGKSQNVLWRPDLLV